MLKKYGESPKEIYWENENGVLFREEKETGKWWKYEWQFVNGKIMIDKFPAWIEYEVIEWKEQRENAKNSK